MRGCGLLLDRHPNPTLNLTLTLIQDITTGAGGADGHLMMTLLLAPSVHSLQTLLSACEAILRQLDLSINANKSVCQNWSPLLL